MKLLRGLAIVILLSSILSAQEHFTRIFGAEDQEVALPTIDSAQIGMKDEAAVSILRSFAISTRLVGVHSMSGSGTAKLPGYESSMPATCSILEGDRTRIDFETEKGVRSLFSSGAQSAIRHEDHVVGRLSPSSGRLPAIAFPFVALMDSAAANIAILDRGVAVVGDRSLHRITIVERIPRRDTRGRGSDDDFVLDLYFEPSTNVLIKSAAAISLDGSSSERYLRVTTYDDYRVVGGVLVPFSFHETLNGQREWSLQLEQIQINPSINAATFEVDNAN